MIWLRATAAWLLILVCAMLNGALREAVLIPRLSLPVAYLISGMLLSLAILFIAIMLAKWLMPGSRRRGWSVGALWLSLTLAFEFGFGRWVQGRSWEELLNAYTFADGNIWPLVLLMTLLAPPIAQVILRRRH